jgi:hypothetical protein
VNLIPIQCWLVDEEILCITIHSFGINEIQVFAWDIFSFFSNRKGQHWYEINASTSRITTHYDFIKISCNMELIVETMYTHLIPNGGTSMWHKTNAFIKLVIFCLQSWNSPIIDSINQIPHHILKGANL